MQSFRTPDGKFTSSWRRYAKEWKKITAPIEEALGVKTYGIDPGLLMSNEDGCGTVDLPLWFAKRLAEKLDSCKAASGSHRSAGSDEQNQGGAQGKGES